MKLIDPDALRKAMYHEAFETDSDMQRWDSGCWIRYKLFENILNNAPTVEAEPVRLGKWIYEETIDMFVCSVCGDMMVRNTYRYCPWCGARMEVRNEKDELLL